MANIPRFLWVVLATSLLTSPGLRAAPAEAAIPEPLKPWQDWVLWGVENIGSPSPYSDGKAKIPSWPSRLDLQVDEKGGKFAFDVTVFSATWVELPGGSETWPLDVRAGTRRIPVVQRAEAPGIFLEPGSYRVEGFFAWSEIPQKIHLPRSIGVLSLSVTGQTVEAPTWNSEGELWLKRTSANDDQAKDFLSLKAYALLEDGIPLWWNAEIELVVSGKSREENLGSVIPEGWRLTEITSPLPVIVDEQGIMKVQVRAGKWTIKFRAYELKNLTAIKYTGHPAAKEQLVAFRAKPDFRMVDVVGSPSIDVAQTTFPAAWRDLPVYLWDTTDAFRLEERVRGMGLQKPQGLKIQRTWWLDGDGGGITFRDSIEGQMQQIWRLDAAQGQELGSVRSNGEGQLVTRNPANGAPGVEIRTRAVNLEATGRLPSLRTLSATGWQTDAGAVDVAFNLPPGWRLFALFGSDWVKGDWLTAWTLLDLFLLLIFSLAVWRIWGVVPALLAFFAFGLSYHEPGAPKYVWLALLIPLALLRVVPDGSIRKLLLVGKWVFIAVFLFVLAPFVAGQIQQALFPQMEVVRQSSWVGTLASRSYSKSGSLLSSSNYAKKENLAYDSAARIQTGPGVPDWTWRSVSFGWNGPVTAGQQVKLLLISVGLERALSILRVILLLALAAVLLGARQWSGLLFGARRSATAMLAIGLLAALGGTAQAQYPNQTMLDTLRERLLQTPAAFPNAAELPGVTLSLKGRTVVLDAEVNAAAQCAVPLPGKLPGWFPASVQIDGKPAAAVRRDNGYLWVVVPEGVYRIRAEGLLTGASEWEWTFLLKPRQVTIDAPDWTYSGVGRNGVPEDQVFFVLKQRTGAGEASYDRQDFQALAVVERNLELGLVWQVRTTVRRLSPLGKAVSLKVPLLPGENILSSGALVRNGQVEVRLGAQEESYEWESELTVTNELTLASRAEDAWVERWSLVASPIWNIGLQGLAPIFEESNPDLVPVWSPWPGESVQLQISRPTAIPGATVTVENGSQELTLGQRQRTTKLDLSLRCSVGDDFLIDLPEYAQVTALSVGGREIPVRKDGSKLIVPVHPGELAISVSWASNLSLGFNAQTDLVRLPVESANIRTEVIVPNNRWVLWTHGPLQGPAVQFWTILACSLVAAIVLSRLTWSPLGFISWMLLTLGLTQVPLAAACIVIGWLFLLEWRGRPSFQQLPAQGYFALQGLIVLFSAITVCIFVVVVAAGLLGSPEMFIRGNDSTRTLLRWYQAQSGDTLPTPGCFSVSIWWYRLLMLAWALWLATALIRWLTWGWGQFGKGGFVKPKPPEPKLVPPPIQAP